MPENKPTGSRWKRTKNMHMKKSEASILFTTSRSTLSQHSLRQNHLHRWPSPGSMHKFNRSWVRRMPSTMKWIANDSKRFCTSTRTHFKGFLGLWPDQHPHCAHPNKPKCTTHICAPVQDSISIIWASARNCCLQVERERWSSSPLTLHTLPDMASPKTQWQNSVPPSTIASWISKYHCPDGLWPNSTKKFQRSKAQRFCPHWTSPLGSGQTLSTLMTNISWHSPLAIDSTPSHGVPSAMPTHQQNSKFSLTKHALMPESEATSSTLTMSQWKAQVWKDHLKEIYHVLKQLTTAGKNHSS